MKINPARETSDGIVLGPRPGAPAAGLSAAAARVLDHLAQQSEPVTVGTLAEVTGLHGNTVRQHLHALVRAGYVSEERAPARGRGRPATLYAATDGATTSQGSEYAGLASALAGHLARTSSAPTEDALAAGAEWGRALTADASPSGSKAEARREVVSLLDQLGFAPQPDARTSVVRLTRCPLLEVAHQHPEVVCGVHLGIVRGALEQHGGDIDRSDLTAFAEPGACRLDLLAPRQH